MFFRCSVEAALVPKPSVKKTTDGTTTSYQKVRDWVLNYIAEHRLKPGARIPSDRVLCKQIGLSRPTIARAINQLVQEGVLVREERAGTYVGGNIGVRPSVQGCTIGVIMPWVTDVDSVVVNGSIETERLVRTTKRQGLTSRILHGIISELNGTGCRLAVHSNTTLFEEAKVLSELPNWGLDGVLVMPSMEPGNEKLYANVIEMGLPLTFLDIYYPNIRADRVVTDNFEAARKAVKYLIDAGHRRIAYFTHFENLTSVSEREAGYRRALEEAGIEVDEALIQGPQVCRGPHWDLRLPLERCMSLPEPATAAFCLNDGMVLLVLQAADELGLSIPDDLMVAGFFDDYIPQGLPVSFTRVVQAAHDMGRIAVRLLLERISGEAPSEPRHVALPAELVPPTTREAIADVRIPPYNR